MPQLFGTDGVRGVAGIFPLDKDTVTRLAAALARFLLLRKAPVRIILAGDTRASTTTLARWFAGSFIGSSGDVVWAGVLPTPGVSHLLRARSGFGAGVIISASHNPASDNGIKILGGSGQKLSSAEEEELEALMGTLQAGGGEALPPESGELRREYVEILKATLPSGALGGLSLVVDAANGAASPVAGEFFSALGAKTYLLHASPDGANINRQCGALFPADLVEAVKNMKADAGVALDGDGDRAVLVTQTGRVLNGDDLLLLWARNLARAGKLPNGTVVATVMSNVALDMVLRREGMRLVRCPVGDREVWETMSREGASLGGEQSGHVICAHYSVTGDGLLTAAHILAQGVEEGQSLEARADLKPFPQVLLAVKVREKRPLADVPELLGTVRECEELLAGMGRVVVRYSGTEMLLRIMVEAQERKKASQLAQKIARAAEKLLV